MAGGEFFFDDGHGDAAGVTLAGEHAEKPAHRYLAIQVAHGSKLAANQSAGRLLFLPRLQLVKRVASQLVVHSPATEFLGQRSLAETTPTMTRLDPRGGERGVIDQPDLGKPIEHLVSDLIRNLPLSQQTSQLSTRPGLPRQLVQQNRPSH